MKPAAIVRSAEGRASGTHVPGASSAMKVLAVAAAIRPRSDGWEIHEDDYMPVGIAGVPMPNEVYVDEDRPRPFPFGFQAPRRSGMVRQPSRQARAAIRRKTR